MSKRTISLASSLLVFVALSPALAHKRPQTNTVEQPAAIQQDNDTVGGAVANPASALHTEGKVVRLDAAKHLLVIEKDDGAQQIFTLDDDTKVVRDEKSVSVTDLHPGARVGVTFEQAGFRWVAQRISLEPAS